MDPNKYLILLKNVDRTLDVVSIDLQEAIAVVQFNGKPKTYDYPMDKVVFRENPTIIDVFDKEIYFEDSPIFASNTLMIFDDKVRIVFNGGQSQVFDLESLRIENEKASMSSVHNILKYWSEISQYTNTEDEKEAFLKKEYDKLNHVHPESVLGSYINRTPLNIISSLQNNVIFPFRFNLSQKEALDHALSSNISVIEGPPGTGKTQTILNIIANLAVMRDKTVAVVSGNNAAVQNVKDKLTKNNYDFIAASLGNKENKDAFFSNIPSYDVSNWKSDMEESELVHKINALNNHIHRLMELDNKRAKLHQELAAYYLEQQHFEHYYNKQNIEEIKRLSFYRQTPNRIISFLADNHLARERNKSNTIMNKVKLFLKYGYTDFKSLKDNEMDVILDLQRKYYVLKIKSLEKKKAALQDELDQGRFDDVLKQHEEYSAVLFRHKLHKKYHEKKSMALDSRSYKGNFDEFTNHFPVVLSTTHSLRNCIPNGYLFDYVIIDESSQVDLLTGVLALSCCKNVIIVGDTKQLPQITNQDIQEKLTIKDIDSTYDYFKHNILSSMLALYGESLPKVILKEHYRCHPKIIGFCNQQYYNGELIPFTSENEEDTPLILYRTSKGNHMRMVTRGEEKGRFNLRELEVIVEEILQNPELNDGNYNGIGFVTPYRKQVQKAANLLDSQIESDTVHKYQGREKPVMIMSTVLDNTYLSKRNISFVDDPCLINVAVSRAQDRFVLVTDHTLFKNMGKEVSDLIRYMEYNALDENIIESEIISVFDLLYKEYSDKLSSLQNSLLNVSKYKSENIMFTLINKLLNEDEFNKFEVVRQVLLKNIVMSTHKLTDEERNYVKNNSSVDFVIYHKLNKQPQLIIEVDGFAYHENNPEQLIRDELKNSVLTKYEIPFIRFPTNGSGEEEKLRDKLNEVLRGIYG